MTNKPVSAPKHGQHTILWWVGWITLTIVSFFIASSFWTPFIAEHFGGMDRSGAPILWVTAVFGSWMVLLVPLIIVMYNKVDRAYEDARLLKDEQGRVKSLRHLPFKTVSIPETERLLPQDLVQKIKRMPRTIQRGHLVSAILKNGRTIPHVFILDRTQVMGVYGYDHAPFAVKDIVDILPANLERLPVFEMEKWLRFDGVELSGR